MSGESAASMNVRGELPYTADITSTACRRRLHLTAHQGVERTDDNLCCAAIWADDVDALTRTQRAAEDTADCDKRLFKVGLVESDRAGCVNTIAGTSTGGGGGGGGPVGSTGGGGDCSRRCVVGC